SSDLERLGTGEVAARDAESDQTEESVQQRPRRFARAAQGVDANRDVFDLGRAGAGGREDGRHERRLQVDLARVTLRAGRKPAQQIERVAVLRDRLLEAVARACD